MLREVAGDRGTVIKCMSENRHYVRPSGRITFKGQGWQVIDRHTGKWVGGYSEERARQLARLLNLNSRLSNVPKFAGNRWNVSGPDTVVYVECDRPRDRAAPGIVGRVRISGRDFECLDVLAGPLPGKPMWIGEPIGLVVQELPAKGPAFGAIGRHRSAPAQPTIGTVPPSYAGQIPRRSRRT